MLIPIRTDYRLKRLPWVNYLIIAANIILFIAGYNDTTLKGSALIEPYLLNPENPHLIQFFSSVFLHANLMHLLGNMLFLFVFGNAINDKLGNLGYLLFYLGGGVFASMGYLLLSGSAPVLGASGAIAAVCGAFLVLLPRTKVTLILFMILITPIYVPSVYAIAVQFVFDLIMTLGGMAGPASGGVAYAAHSSGYIFGIAVGMLLLWAGLVKRDNFDMLHILQQYHRRQQLNQAIAGGYDPFGQTPPRKVRVTVKSQQPPSPEEKVRRQIVTAISKRDLAMAAGSYVQLLEMNSEAILPQQYQLDVANQLMAGQAYEPAAKAYELFRKYYGNYEYIGDINLMLGILYSRYLHKADLARSALEKAVSQLTESGKLNMARQCLDEIK